MSEEGQQIQQKPTKPPTPDKPSTNLSIVKIESDEDEDPGAMEMYINMSGGGGESIRVQRADHTDQEEGDPQADWMRDEMSNEDSNVSGDQSNSWVYPPGSQAQYKGGYLFFLLLLRKFAVQDVCWNLNSSPPTFSFLFCNFEHQEHIPLICFYQLIY